MGRQPGDGSGSGKGGEGLSPCPDDPPAPPVTVPAWAESHLWPGWERDDFLAWCEKHRYVETSEPWRLFATWYRTRPKKD